MKEFKVVYKMITEYTAIVSAKNKGDVAFLITGGNYNHDEYKSKEEYIGDVNISIVKE